MSRIGVTPAASAASHHRVEPIPLVARGRRVGGNEAVGAGRRRDRLPGDVEPDVLRARSAGHRERLLTSAVEIERVEERGAQRPRRRRGVRLVAAARGEARRCRRRGDSTRRRRRQRTRYLEETRTARPRVQAISRGRGVLCGSFTTVRRRAELVAPGADVRILGAREREGERVPGARRTSRGASPSSSPSASSVALKMPLAVRRDAAPPSATLRSCRAGAGPSRPAWSLVASRPQTLTVVLLAGRRRTGSGRRSAPASARAFSSDVGLEVQAALVRARARIVLEQEPRHERDAREPHLVQRLRRPAGGES